MCTLRNCLRIMVGYFTKVLSSLNLYIGIAILFGQISMTEGMVYRLGCKRNAVFFLGGNNLRCVGKVLETRIGTFVQCSSRCLILDGCGIISTKILSSGLNSCQLIKGFVGQQACKTMDDNGSKYFYLDTDSNFIIQKLFSYQKEKIVSRFPEERFLPSIYIPFDRIFCQNSFLYSIGHHDNDTVVPPVDYVGLKFDPQLQRAVLVKNAITGNILGYFSEHHLTEPCGKELSIALWLKISPLSSENDYVNYIFTAKYAMSGIFLGQEPKGPYIRFAAYSMRGQWKYDKRVPVPKINFNWMHVALTFSGKGSGLRLYLNGTLLSYVAKPSNQNVSKKRTTLTLGNVERASRFAFWTRALREEEIWELYVSA